MYVHCIYIYDTHIYLHIHYIYIHDVFTSYIWNVYVIMYIYILWHLLYMYMIYGMYMYIYIYWWDVHSLLMQRNKCNKADSNLLYSSRQALMQCGLLASTLTMWLVVYSRGQFCNKKWFPGIEKKPSASRKLWLESWQAWPSEITKKCIITNEPGYNLLMRLWSSCSNWLQTPNVCLHYLGLPHLAGL